MITFTITGVPQPAGSKRAFPIRRPGGHMGVAVADANPKAKAWKEVVATAARMVYDGPLLDGIIVVSFSFYLPRPKGHFGKRGIKPSAPKLPTVKPDCLKLARAVEDALTGVIWRDDAQIVTEIIRKRYSETGGRVEVVIEELTESAGDE